MKIVIPFISGLLIMISHPAAQHERTAHWHMRTQLFKDQLTTAPKGGNVFLGNSITEGFNLRHYFPRSQPLNRGINGDHIDGLLDRLDYSVIQLAPTRLFILIGINDIGAGDSDSTILANYEKLLDRLSQNLPQTEIFVQSILPTSREWSNCPREKIRRLNNSIEQFVRIRNFHWLNIYSAFVDSTGYLNTDLTTDGLHLSQHGYEKWQSILNETGLR